MAYILDFNIFYIKYIQNEFNYAIINEHIINK